MIRPLGEKDFDTVCGIVNENWKNVYSGYVNPLLLNSDGCAVRTHRLKTDFAARRLSEYVWEEEKRVWRRIKAKCESLDSVNIVLIFTK